MYEITQIVFVVAKVVLLGEKSKWCVCSKTKTQLFLFAFSLKVLNQQITQIKLFLFSCPSPVPGAPLPYGSSSIRVANRAISLIS